MKRPAPRSNASLFEVSGLSFTPFYVWLDDNNQFLASVEGWSGLVRQGFEPSLGTLEAGQRKVKTARAAELASKLTHKPAGDLVFKNVAVFDSVNAKVIPAQRVTVRGEKIVSVEPEQNQPVASGAEVIDANGQMLLPGLWDMHSHLDADSAFLNIATGVTTIRDMGNPIDDLGAAA